MSVSSLWQNSLSAKLGMVTPEISRRTLFLKAHIYKSMTLNGRGRADCDEDHRSLQIMKPIIEDVPARFGAESRSEI